MSSSPGRRFPDRGLDLLLAGTLMGVATAVRLPYLHQIPVATDETFEVLAALSITHGNWIVFGPINPTAGPLFAYSLALVFWLFGPGIYLARTVVMIAGVLTVGVTYFLGRSMGGRRAGLIGGVLLAFSPVHTLVNSHVAWSNSITPLLVALTCLVLHQALRWQDGWLLVLGGLLFGLSLQTHVSVLVLIPGLLVWFLARRGAITWLRQPWPYLAALAALLGYGNMIAYNLLTPGGSLADFQGHSYAWVAEPTWSTYWENLRTMVGAVAPTLGGQVPRIKDAASGLVMVLLLAWLVAALIYAARRRETMPILALVSTLMIMPYFNQRFEGLLSQRYTAFLLPLCYATMGLGAAALLDRWQKRGSRLARAAVSAGVILALILAVCPVRGTFAYYAAETRAGRDNTLSLAMTSYLRDALPSGTPLYVSSNLRGVRADGGFRYLRAVYYYLTLEGVEHWVLDLPDILARLEADPAQEAWLLLPVGDYEALAEWFDVKPVEDAPRVHNEGVLARYLPPAGQP